MGYHNCDRPDYPLALLSDPELTQYDDGSGFHHHGGDLRAMTMVHLARPENLYFTGQMAQYRGQYATIQLRPGAIGTNVW